MGDFFTQSEGKLVFTPVPFTLFSGFLIRFDQIAPALDKGNICYMVADVAYADFTFLNNKISIIRVVYSSCGSGENILGT